MKKLPREIQDRLKERLGLHDFETWIKPLTLNPSAGGEITIEVPSTLFRDWLNENYLDAIKEEFNRYYGEAVPVGLSVNPSRPAPEAPPPPKPAAKPADSSTPIPRYTFENFVVGTSNQFAHAACLAVASRPAEHYNPLFIYGGVGLGKTHLVNALGNRLMEQGASQKVVYTTSESFMNSLISSLRRDRMNEFKNHFRSIDVLILDDIQFIAGKERTQEEFFHTFNSLYENHKQIILTSDRFPKEIPDLEDRLRNRFEWGLTADIQPPDIETRIAILLKKAEEEEIDLPYEVADFVAAHIRSNVRELEGSLTRLGAFAALTKVDITIDLAREALKHTLRENEEKVTVRNIQRAICEHFDVKISDLKSKQRTKKVAVARQVAMYLCRKYTATSYPAIGAEFGGRDHSTVIHASKTIARKATTDPEIKATVERLERQLKR
ncbi:MAG: chromosomal replication initiator protein DnaA [Deltaproteobacteria bacterium]|nr:chromosomal replication initiator protein DnaA [Deltaproteobacteria bacterium]